VEAGCIAFAAGHETRKEKSMAKTRSNAQGDGLLQGRNITDEVVSQVGKAAAEIMKLRESFEDTMTKAQTEEEAQDLANQVETAAVRVISDQGLTVDQYNQVIAAAEQDANLEERVLTACRAA
jgi:hypothetical protein